MRCEVDFDARTVAFFVNGEAAGGAVEWMHGDAAYPAISSEGGTVECMVRCISGTGHIQEHGIPVSELIQHIRMQSGVQ